jgi:hypothetical protein
MSELFSFTLQDPTIYQDLFGQKKLFTKHRTYKTG